MDINNVLKSAGLSDSEIAVYLAAVSVNVPQTSGVVAKRAKLKPSTTTMALQSLAKKSLVSSFQQENSTYYSAEPPNQILKMLDRKHDDIDTVKQNIEKILPEIEKSISPFSIKPRIKIYEGKSAIEGVFLDMMERDDLIRGCASLNKEFDEDFDIFWDNYFKKAKSLDKKFRVIVPDTVEGKAYKQRGKSENRETILVSHKDYFFDTEKHIVGDAVATISLHKDSMIAIVIEDQKIANSEKQFFDLVWNSLIK